MDRVSRAGWWVLAAIVASSLGVAACRPRSTESDPPPTTPAPPAGRIVITTGLPGADASRIEQEVVVPIEHAISTVAGVESIRARAQADLATITVELTRPAALDAAVVEVEQRLARLARQLPTDAQLPIITRVRDDDAPVRTIALSGSLPRTSVAQLVDDVLVPRLLRVPGVARVDPHGLPRVGVVIRPDLARLAAADVTLHELGDALRAHAEDLPSGRLDPGTATVRAPQPGGLKELSARVVAQRGASAIRIADLAVVELGPIDEPERVEPRLDVHAQLGADDTTVASAVHAALAELALPAGLQAQDAAPAPRPAPSLVVAIRGPEWSELVRLADAVSHDVRLAGGTDIAVDPPPGRPTRAIVPDRAGLARCGVPVEQATATIRAALGGDEIASAWIDGRVDPVLVRLPDARLEDLLPELSLRGADGHLCSLASVAAVAAEATPPVLTRLDGERAITITVGGADTRAARASVDRIAAGLPPGYRVVIAADRR